MLTTEHHRITEADVQRVVRMPEASSEQIGSVLFVRSTGLPDIYVEDSGSETGATRIGEIYRDLVELETEFVVLLDRGDFSFCQGAIHDLGKAVAIAYGAACAYLDIHGS